MIVVDDVGDLGLFVSLLLLAVFVFHKNDILTTRWRQRVHPKQQTGSVVLC